MENNNLINEIIN